MPVHREVLIRDLILNFNNDDVIDANADWRAGYPVVDGESWLVQIVERWSDSEFKLASSRFDVEFARPRAGVF